MNQPLEEAKEGIRQPHHNDARPGLTNAAVERQYEQAVRDACSILVCNYSALTMAVNMGFAGRHHVASDKNQDRFQAQRGQVNEMKELVGGELLSAAPPDIAVRI